MKVSTKGIYALEVAVDLAINSSEHTLVSLNSIAKRRNLSEKYLERIIGPLRKAGIVVSARGAFGGYRLARPAKEIMVSAILEATEGNMAPVDCLSIDFDKCAFGCDKCVTRKMWQQMWEEIKNVIGTTTLEDLVKKTKEYPEGIAENI